MIPVQSLTANPADGARPATVSVIIPAYNRAGFLPSCVKSIIAQTHPISEIFIVDDGSTDETAAVVESLKMEVPSGGPRILYLWQPNAGKSVALNRALERVSGEWIAFNDSDDLWYPEKIERQFEALRRHPDCLACFTNASYSHHYSGRDSEFEGGLEVTGETGRLPDHLRMALTNRRIRMITLIVRADAMRSVGPFDPALRVAQDIDFVFRLALVTPLCYVSRPLVEINHDPAHATRLTVQHMLASRTRDQAHVVMMTKWKKLLRNASPDLRRQLDRDLWRKRSALANHLLLDGDVAEARRVLRGGLRDQFNPRFLLKLGITVFTPRLYARSLQRRAERKAATPAPSR